MITRIVASDYVNMGHWNQHPPVMKLAEVGHDVFRSERAVAGDRRTSLQ